MSQDTVIKSRDNPVTFVFSFTGDFAANGLNNFNRITLSIGGESYDSTIDTDRLIIDSATELTLDIGEVTALSNGAYTPEIVGYNAIEYVNGYALNSTCVNRLIGKVKVC